MSAAALIERFAVRDADLYAAGMRPIARIAVLGTGAFHADLLRIRLGGLMLQEADIGQPLAAVMHMPPAMVFGFGPASHATETWNGQPLMSDCLVAHRPGGEAHLASRGGAWGSLTLTPDTLERAAQGWFGRPLGAPRFLLRPRGGALARLRALHADASRLARRDDHALRGAAGEALQSALTAALLQCLDNAEAPPARGQERHGVMLRKLEELCDADDVAPLNLTALCHAMGVSHRSLQLLCRDVFGLSPRAYLRHRRMQRAHAALLRAAPEETTVSSVAMQLGFWELGRFATAYRRQFGEKPSETLRRAG